MRKNPRLGFLRSNSVMDGKERDRDTSSMHYNLPFGLLRNENSTANGFRRKVDRMLPNQSLSDFSSLRNDGDPFHIYYS